MVYLKPFENTYQSIFQTQNKHRGERTLKKVIIFILSIGLLAGVGYYMLIGRWMPAKEEYISYDKEKQKQQIEQQLNGIDIEKIREKAPIIMEKSVEQLQTAISNGELSYEELTAFYLDRILTYDTGVKGLNAVAEINPNAMEEARAHDLDPKKGEGIFGLPVLIKDNVNTKNMPTGAGTYALKDFVPESDAKLVEELTKNGAIVLGKSNLSELANFMDSRMPSGYNAKSGQTHNPFDPITLSPKGSSSGSAVAVAANFCVFAIGTETTGSIIAPAAIQSVVGLKPTKDAISTEGVFPLSSTMDTVGTIGKSVKDAVLLYNASLSEPSKSIQPDYNAENIKGKRIGLAADDNDGILSKN